MSLSLSENGATANRVGDGEHFDVIIIGSRCAGAPLATLLARAGVRVVVLEQATFPQETLSSHLMEADALSFLKRLGLLKQIEATGVRFHQRADILINDLRIRAPFTLRFDDLGGTTFLRRHLLDAILADGAVEAGADVRMGTKVVEVLRDNGRVSGVRVQRRGREGGDKTSTLHAPLVVGADGRNSTLAAAVGSRKYNLTPNGRSYYFTFFEDWNPDYADSFLFHRWGDRMVWGGPADSDLFLLGVSPEMHERDEFRTDTERMLLAHMRSCEPAFDALGKAKIATKISGIRRFEGYYREPIGPGWVLVGDAGHFKDPALGRGIGDAFIQAEALAPRIVAGLGGAAGGVDVQLRHWADWRDERFAGHYWLTTDLGAAGAIPAMITERIRLLQANGELDVFFDLFYHRSSYYDVFSLPRLAESTLRLLVSGREPRGPLLRESLPLLARELRRRWINRHPSFAPGENGDPAHRAANSRALEHS
ncbi:NAD(P)/FAD-dependent oxidoreductase [Nocardia sp. NPDC003482]